MNNIILINHKFKDRLGSVRQVPGWKAAANSSGIWLRGPASNGVFQTALNSLPATANYVVDEEGRLFPRGKQTPVGLLAEMQWRWLAEFIPVNLPVSALPGEINLKVEVKLSRSTVEREIQAVKTNLSTWKAFAETAPAIRLQQLRFAVSETKEVLILGTPLPILNGKLYWLNKRCLLPVGFDFDPHLLADLLPQTGDIMLFDEIGNAGTLPEAALANASRSVIRLLKE